MSVKVLEIDKKKDFNFLVLGSYHYFKPFLRIGNVLAEGQKTKADCIVFTGGEDVNPKLYGEERHEKCSATNDIRDAKEIEMFNYALANGIPMVGICRGAQFLNVMNGGKLVQHITGHLVNHDIEISDFSDFKQKKFNVNSTHHQLIVPDITKSHELLGYSRNNIKTMTGIPLAAYTAYSKKYPDTPLFGKEVEVLWYDTTNSLCVQYHPERLDTASYGALYFEHLLKGYIL